MRIDFNSCQQHVNVWGDVAALLRSHMIGLLPFESTIEQTKVKQVLKTIIKQRVTEIVTIETANKIT